MTTISFYSYYVFRQKVTSTNRFLCPLKGTRRRCLSVSAVLMAVLEELLLHHPPLLGHTAAHHLQSHKFNYTSAFILTII